MEKVLNQILDELKTLNQRFGGLDEGQKELQKDVQALKSGQGKLQKDVTGTRNELGYVWDDIKKIDARLSTQEEELVILKRFK